MSTDESLAPSTEKARDSEKKAGHWQRGLSLFVHAPVFLFVALGLYGVTGGDPKGTAVFVLTLAPFLLGFALALAAKDRIEPRVKRLLLASAAVSVLIGGVDFVWTLGEIAAGFTPDSDPPANLVYLFPFIGAVYTAVLAVLARPMGLLDTKPVRQTAWCYAAFLTGTVCLALILPAPNYG